MAVAVRLPESIRLDQEYVILNGGNAPSTGQPGSVELFVEGVDHIWLKELVWTTEAKENGAESVIELVSKGDGSAVFRAVRAGTDYILVSITVEGETWTARCRVDVVENTGEHPVYDAISQFRLLNPKATVELYKTDYTQIEVIPELVQNFSAAADSPTIVAPQEAKPAI